MPRGRVAQDWTGQIFYNCKILEPITEAVGYKKWKVLCHCGKIFEAPPSSVKQGMYQSCGCYRIKASRERMLSQKLWESQRKEFIGNEYNGCKIISKVNENEVCNNKSYYNILCSCGKIFQARVSNIQSGVIRSCGCAKLGTKEWHRQRRIDNGFDPDVPMMEISEYFRHMFFPYEIKEIIYKRDNFECQLCKIQDSGCMVVHHIIPVKELISSKDINIIKKIYDDKNLITLCQPCHTYSAHNGNDFHKEIDRDTQNKLFEICKHKTLNKDLLSKYIKETDHLYESLKEYLSRKIS